MEVRSVLVGMLLVLLAASAGFVEISKGTVTVNVPPAVTSAIADAHFHTVAFISQIADAIDGPHFDQIKASVWPLYASAVEISKAWLKSLTWCEVCAIVALVLVARFLYPILFSPFVRILSYEEFRKKVKAPRPSARKAGDLPPAYPNGWFRILFSHELKKGEVKKCDYLGQNFAVFRDSKGLVTIMDAYCPHLGANLAVLGVVKGDCIECPFHAWQFKSQTGECTNIPYSADPTNTPKGSSAKVWPCREVNGVILVWHDAEGREPYWEPINVKAITNGRFKFHGYTEHVISAHVQEMPENGPDAAHLNVVHKDFIIPYFPNFMSHGWTGQWEASQNPETPHVTNVVVTHNMQIFGWNVPFTVLAANVNQVGPGLVYLHFNTPFGKAWMFEMVTPMEPLKQKACHQIWASPWMPRFFAKLMLWGLIEQFERDLTIWNNKTFRAAPVLVREEIGITKFRAWFKQFYSESSISCAKAQAQIAAGSALSW